MSGFKPLKESTIPAVPVVNAISTSGPAVTAAITATNRVSAATANNVAIQIPREKPYYTCG